MTEKDLNPFSKDNNTLLIHIKNVPNCIKESRVDMRGYKLKQFYCIIHLFIHKTLKYELFLFSKIEIVLTQYSFLSFTFIKCKERVFRVLFKFCVTIAHQRLKSRNQQVDQSISKSLKWKSLLLIIQSFNTKQKKKLLLLYVNNKIFITMQVSRTYPGNNLPVYTGLSFLNWFY